MNSKKAVRREGLRVKFPLGAAGEDPEVAEARREAEERRKEKHRKMEEEREEVRQGIRDKVGALRSEGPAERASQSRPAAEW